MVHLDSSRVSRAPPYSGYLEGVHLFKVQDCYLLWSKFPQRSSTNTTSHIKVLQPLEANLKVWAIPRPLAATDGISIDFFSCGYLDVSVPRVRFRNLCIQLRMTEHNPCRVPPFGNLGVKDCLRLVRAYRSLPRPSSLPGAKASTLRS